MNNLIARGVAVVAIGISAASIAMLGAGAAHADALIGKTYSDARSVVSDKMHATPVLATVNGAVLDLDDCIVVSWSKSAAVSALGETDGKKILLNLNCNAKVAAAGTPGNSATTPQGKSAKKDIESANKINNDPKTQAWCQQSDDNLTACQKICNRTGVCEIDS